MVFLPKDMSEFVEHGDQEARIRDSAGAHGECVYDHREANLANIITYPTCFRDRLCMAATSTVGRDIPTCLKQQVHFIFKAVCQTIAVEKKVLPLLLRNYCC